MPTIISMGGAGMPVSDYEALLTEYVTYKSSHSHTNDEYTSYGAQQYAAGEANGEANIKENYFSSATKIKSFSVGSGTYKYTLTAPSDGTYLLMVGYSAYASSGWVTLGTGVTQIIRWSWSSKYGSNGGVNVIAKFKAGQTAEVGVAGQNRDGGNHGEAYEIWRLSD